MGEAIVVIGVGNPERGDDGLGPEVLASLEGRIPPGVGLVSLSGADPSAIMGAWAGARRAILVDAMVSGRPPGTLARFDAAREPLPAAVCLPSTHALGAAEALELGRVLGRLPGEVVVCGVEGAAFAPGTGLSPAVAAAVEPAAALVLEEVGRA